LNDIKPLSEFQLFFLFLQRWWVAVAIYDSKFLGTHSNFREMCRRKTWTRVYSKTFWRFHPTTMMTNGKKNEMFSGIPRKVSVRCWIVHSTIATGWLFISVVCIFWKTTIWWRECESYVNTHHGGPLKDENDERKIILIQLPWVQVCICV
jgi:hypothetical protein